MPIRRCRRTGLCWGPEGPEPTDVLVLRPSVSLTTVANSVDVDLGDTLGAVLQYLQVAASACPTC